MTIQINSQDFIQTISSEEQVAIFFSVEDSNSSKIENKLDTFITKSNEDSVKPYKIYKLSIEDNDKNYELCQHLNVEENIITGDLTTNSGWTMIGSGESSTFNNGTIVW